MNININNFASFTQNRNMNMPNNQMINSNNNMNIQNINNIDNQFDNLNLQDLFNNQDSKIYKKELELDDETYILTLKKENTSHLSIFLENKLDFLSLYNYSITLSYNEFCKLGKTFRLFDNIDEIFDIIRRLLNGVEFSFRKDNDIPGQANQNNQQNQNSNNNIHRNNNMAMMNNRAIMNNNMFMNNMGMSNNNRIMNNLSTSDNIDKVCSNIKLVHPNSNADSMTILLKIPLLNEKYEIIKINLKSESKDIKTQYEKLKKKYLKIMDIAFCKQPNMQNNNMNNNMMNDSNYLNSINNMNNMNNNMNNQNPHFILEKIKDELNRNI